MNNKKNQKKWIKMIEENLELGGKSDVTVRNYVYAITHFFNAHSETTKLSNFTEKNIINYLKKEYLNKGCKSSTYNFNLNVLKFFFAICFNKEFNSKILPSAKIGRRIPKIIAKEDFIILFNKENNLEHKCWLLLGFCCGLREDEISILKIEDIDSKNHKLKVIGKGNKERFTILPDIVINFLRLYYNSKNYKIKNGYLFQGCNANEHISSNTIGNYFTNIPKFNSLIDTSFHTLRHSFATYYLMNGGSQFILKDLLGHASLSTTAIYVHLANDFNNLKGINYHEH